MLKDLETNTLPYEIVHWCMNVIYTRQEDASDAPCCGVSAATDVANVKHVHTMLKHACSLCMC